jgi:hypothetical protein
MQVRLKGRARVSNGADDVACHYHLARLYPDRAALQVSVQRIDAATVEDDVVASKLGERRFTLWTEQQER